MEQGYTYEEALVFSGDLNSLLLTARHPEKQLKENYNVSKDIYLLILQFDNPPKDGVLEDGASAKEETTALDQPLKNSSKDEYYDILVRHCNSPTVS